MFRFTIRDVLLVMAVVGLGTGWGIDHWRNARNHEEQAHQIYLLKVDVQMREDILDATNPDWREALRRY